MKGIKAAGLWYGVEAFRNGALPVGVSSAVGGATLRASPSVATAQAITGQATTNPM